MFTFDVKFNTLPTKFGKFVQKSGWEHNGRKIDSHLFIFVISGKAVFKFNNETFTIEKGDMLYIPKNTYYTAAADNYIEYYFIHISYTENMNVSISDEEASPALQYPWFNNFIKQEQYRLCTIDYKNNISDNFDRIMRHFAKCEEFFSLPDSASKLFLVYEIYKILTLSSNDINYSNYPKALTDILHYINQNYHEPLSLSLLSKKFAFSESYIARLFKMQLNTTVSTYINNIRLEHASNYISNTNLSIAEIAELCGYNDIAYFSRKYKNKYGESPKSSRNRL